MPRWGSQTVRNAFSHTQPLLPQQKTITTISCIHLFLFSSWCVVSEILFMIFNFRGSLTLLSHFPLKKSLLPREQGHRVSGVAVWPTLKISFSISNVAVIVNIYRFRGNEGWCLNKDLLSSWNRRVIEFESIGAQLLEPCATVGTYRLRTLESESLSVLLYKACRPITAAGSKQWCEKCFSNCAHVFLCLCVQQNPWSSVWMQTVPLTVLYSLALLTSTFHTAIR